MQGFLQADPFVLPEVNNPSPVPPDGPFKNPTFFSGFRPIGNGTQQEPSGYYPYSVAGFIEFDQAGSFTGEFRVNIGGNTPPYQGLPQPTNGNYKLSSNGTGVLTFFENGSPTQEWFIIVVDPEEEILATITWGIHRVPPPPPAHRRLTGAGQLKKMKS